MSDDTGAAISSTGAAASSAAPTTASVETSASTASANAPATGAPAIPDGQTAAPATEPGPVPYSRFYEVNEELKAMREWKQKHGWAEQVQIEPESLQQLHKWHQSYKADPIQWYAQTTQELRQLYPHLVPNLTSEAARILRSGRSLEPEPDVEPDIPVFDANGQQVNKTGSWEAINKLVERRLQDLMGKEIAPIKQTFQQQQQAAHQAQVKRQTEQAIQTLYEKAKTWHGFTDHEPAIAQALTEHQDWSLHDAYLHVLHTEILPKADQKSQAKLLDHLQTQAAGATVHPSASQGNAIPKFKSFKEAAEFYDKHPELAEAAAQR